MSRACFAPECQLITFGMDDWEEKLEQEMPDFLLVESAWSGNDGKWQYGVASYTHPHYKGLPQLKSLIAWCRERDIPTAFWNKEDPIHFDRFAEAAALFDHIFTTDENRIPSYEALQGEHVKGVLALPFAAQPRIHNPIRRTSERHSEPVFAGTYYRDRHVDRRKSLEMILDAARPLGLIIYDRTFGTESKAYGFPERFLPHVKGRLPYEKVIDVYKSHKVFLNVNSVTDSPTMFSRRVFELLACDTAVVSTESVGISRMFGELVPIATKLEGATAQITRLTEDDDFRRRLIRRARRLVLSRDNYTERLAFVADAVGINVTRAREGDVAALVSVDRSAVVSRFGELVEDIVGQSRKPTEVVIDLPDGIQHAGLLERLRASLGSDAVKLVTHTEADHPVHLATVAGLATTPWVAPLRVGTRYGAHHFADLTACTSYAEADVIAAAVALDGAAQVEHSYSDWAHPDFAIAKRELVSARGWPAGGGEDRYGGWFSSGVRFYVADEPDGSEA
jgi:spore maturation protein CgeB